MNEYKRGYLYFYHFEYGEGSEQMGKRPCVIMSNDLNNKYSPNVTIVPITGQRKKSLPTHVSFSTFTISGTALAEQVTTISKTRLEMYCGFLNNDTMKLIEKAVMIQLGIDFPEAME